MTPADLDILIHIEKAGTGIKRIRDEARAQGCPEPVWEANGFVTAIFRPNPAVRAQAAAQQGEVGPEVKPEGSQGPS